jgi:hypothetical protein
MADNGWMYSGRVSATNKTDEWICKAQMLVKELVRSFMLSIYSSTYFLIALCLYA